MRVNTHRRAATLEITFKITGAPIVLNNPALASQLNPIIAGTVPARFSAMVSRDNFPGEGPPYNLNELNHIGELEVRKFMQNYLAPETLHANGLTLTMVNVKLVLEDN